MFQTIRKKSQDVDNDVLYDYAKFQPEIFCIPSYTKRTNPDKSEIFWTLHYSHHRSRNLSFLQIAKYRIFRTGILHIGRNSHVLRLGFVSHFFETRKCAFRTFQKNELRGAHPPNHRTRSIRTNFVIGPVNSCQAQFWQAPFFFTHRLSTY